MGGAVPRCQRRTVDAHRARILEKTGCNNTASLVAYAVKMNLVEV